METMRKVIGNGLVIALLFLAFSAKAQEKKTTAEEYIALYKDLAISEMKRTGIPASITLAQGLLESGCGNSALAKESNNHFGIKCKKDWTGKTANYDDDAPQECFRVYDKANDSYIDHSDFLRNSPRYASLFELDATDYKSWANGLKQAGYATNPKYPDLLISAIEKYSLYQYDLGNKRVPKEDNSGEIFVKNTPANDIQSYNGLPVYVVKNGDTYDKIAKNKKMMRWEIAKYNDLSSADKLQSGTILYLKPKHRKGKQEYHVVQEGESMYYIAQANAIKLKLLYKWNRMEAGQEPEAGEKLNLRKKRDAAPKLRTDKKYASEKRGINVNQQQDAVAENKPVTNKVVENKPVKQDKPEQNQTASTQNTPEKTTSTTTTYKQTEKNTWVPPVQEFNPNAEFYTVAEGETLEKVAYRYHVTVQDIKLWNEMTDESLYAGQLLRVKGVKSKVSNNNSSVEQKQMPDGNIKEEVVIPDENIAVEKPVENIPQNGFYIVQTGETLFSISRKLNISVADIHSWNNLEDNSLTVGQKLRVKPNGNIETEERNTAGNDKSNSNIYHEVQAGETLYSISRKYSITVDALKKLNGLTENTLSLGQKLKVKED